MPMTYALPASSQLVCLLPQESFYGAAEEVRSRVRTHACLLYGLQRGVRADAATGCVTPELRVCCGLQVELPFAGEQSEPVWTRQF